MDVQLTSLGRRKTTLQGERDSSPARLRTRQQNEENEENEENKENEENEENERFSSIRKGPRSSSDLRTSPV